MKELNADVPFSEILELPKNNQYLSFETMFFLSLMKDQPAFYDLINFQNPQMNQSLQSLARTTTFFEREQSIVALQAQVQDLQTGNAWLSSQSEAWEKAAATLQSQVHDTAERLSSSEAILNKIRNHWGMRFVNYLSKTKFF